MSFQVAYTSHLLCCTTMLGSFADILFVTHDMNLEISNTVPCNTQKFMNPQLLFCVMSFGII